MADVLSDSDERASGDVKLSKDGLFKDPVPEPPVVPDVELVVDGFGFMPIDRSSSKRKSSSLDKGVVEELAKEASQGKYSNSCPSSSSMDIVRRYTWTTKNRMIVQVITYGATITSIQVPDKKGNPDDIIAGFDTMDEYLQPQNPYFGATIGRCASYVRDGTFCLKPNGKMYMLTLNKGYHHYHGGHVGFDKVNWRSYVVGKKVIMSHVSERFEEGYPGTLMTQISFEVTCENTLQISMKCTTSEPTIVNLSHAPYFNLAGHYSGPDRIYEHIITINADKYTAVSDEDGIVTGEKKVVGGTPYDLRVPRSLKSVFPMIPYGGFNLNYCVTQGIDQDLTFHARAVHPQTGRVVEVYSNQPGLQFYTGNDLPDPDKIVEPIYEKGDSANESEAGEKERDEKDDENIEADNKKGERKEGDEKDEEDKKEGGDDETNVKNASEGSAQSSKIDEEASEEESQGQVGVGYVPLVGKGGTFYKKHGLFCFMPQNYPNAINHNNFPKCTLNPGEVYVHKIEYKFGLLLGRYV